MLFGYHGRTYDTADMTAYYTGSRQTPVFFLTQDRQNVFVLAMGQGQEGEVRPAQAQEVQALAQRYGLAELLGKGPKV